MLWSIADEQLLLKLLSQQLPWTEIAATLKRTVQAVQAQKLRLDTTEMAVICWRLP
jgi:hypothetical protein